MNRQELYRSEDMLAVARAEDDGMIKRESVGGGKTEVEIKMGVEYALSQQSNDELFNLQYDTATQEGMPESMGDYSGR